jgi:hypothetical protein
VLLSRVKKTNTSRSMQSLRLREEAVLFSRLFRIRGNQLGRMVWSKVLYSLASDGSDFRDCIRVLRRKREDGGIIYFGYIAVVGYTYVAA